MLRCRGVLSRRAWPHPATGTERTRPHDPGWKGQHPESESQKWDLKEHVEVSHVSRLCNHQQRLLAQTKSKNGGNIRAPEGGETSRLSQEQDPILLGARGVKGGDGDQGGGAGGGLEVAEVNLPPPPPPHSLHQFQHAPLHSRHFLHRSLGASLP